VGVGDNWRWSWSRGGVEVDVEMRMEAIMTISCMYEVKNGEKTPDQ